jgi:hypothetical protein
MPGCCQKVMINQWKKKKIKMRKMKMKKMRKMRKICETRK